VAELAGIAAGTVYRYFPSKDDLVAALVAATAKRELAAVRGAAAAAPGPLSALAAAIMALAESTLRARRLAWAMLGEASESNADVGRLAFRRGLSEEFETLIDAAITAGHLPDQIPATAAAAVIGATLESLAGPLAPDQAAPDATRAAAKELTLFALRALGVVDARARGLVIAGISGQ